MHLEKSFCTLIWIFHVVSKIKFAILTFVIDWPNSLDCTDLKISVEPAVTQNCVASVSNMHNHIARFSDLL